MQNPQNLKSEGTKRVDSLISSIVTDMHALTKILKPISRAASQTNSSLTTKMALRGQRDCIETVNQLLSYLMNIIQLKQLNGYLITILAKLISLTKMILQTNESTTKFLKDQKYNQQGSIFLHQIIDLVFVLNGKTQEQDVILRIIQMTYSLVEPHLIIFADYNMLTRLYSICFKCCLSSPNILSISISALFSLTELAFANCDAKNLINIMIQMLEMLLHTRKCSWVKDLRLNSIIWDIVLIAIKHFPMEKLQEIQMNQKLCSLLNQMYQLALDFVFQTQFKSNHRLFLQSLRLDHQKHTNPQKQYLVDFIKIFKTYVYFSIKLSLTMKKTNEIVPFRKKLDLLHILYDHFLSTKLFIYLEGISLILSHASYLIFEEPAGIMLIDLFKKLSQQLYQSKVALQIVWQITELRIQRMFSDYSKVSHQDYIRLLKKTLLKLRKDVEQNNSIKTQHLLNQSQDQSLQMSNISMDSQLLKNENEPMMFMNRWKLLIKTVARIIRYITSLKFKQESNDQVVRKFLTELQFWFIICPNNKTRAIILHQLQNAVIHVENKNQAIKASQSIQICTNIIYGYYHILDSVGIANLLKTIAYSKIHLEDGKDFDQLQEVCLVTDKFYIQQKVIDSEPSFLKTVQGFIQCANILLADMQLPTNNSSINSDPKKETAKYLRLIQYVFIKLRFVIEQNYLFLPKKWSYIVGFWVSFCSCKIAPLRIKTIHHLGLVLSILRKKALLHQNQLVYAYCQISKLQQADVSSLLVSQLKNQVANMRQQSALVGIFQIIRQTMGIKKDESVRQQAFQLQEMLIKESLFKIKTTQYIIKVIDTLSLYHKTKNQQYRTVSLLWCVSDHIKALEFSDKDSQTQRLWRHLFEKILQFGNVTTHPQTKATCMHTFTQILADCSKAIGDQLFTSILFKQYLYLFTILMCYTNCSANYDSIIKVQMQRAAIKSYIKLCKKCISQNNPRIKAFIEEAISLMTINLELKQKKFSVEYFFQFLVFIQFFKEINMERKAKQNHIVGVKQVKKLLIAVERSHQGLEKQGYFWKKKYEPQFIQLKKQFDEDEDQPVIKQSLQSPD